ncbi:MlaD family protein [Nocardia aurantiaca]|uniref:MCE family protein n=1 Tax=Nocardia aurantiaca TaxID=2675850 RepID=A0A6I3L5C0_9NOCA|nr:MlaD family protein [Nocardia aurantiaca]MTE16721.1 MCE family protein [Nocardia aurantiaca]
MKSLSGVIWRLALFVAAMAVLATVIVQAIERPVAGRVDHYTALFTDANGLESGDDVRMYGVQVGKVDSLTLDAGNKARVQLTVRDDRPVYDTSTLAIRYQSLTGQRYVDVRQPDRPGIRLAAGATVGVDHTTPSFDITKLFNGLKPVLAEFSPEALNQFSTSLLAVIEGDGKGIGPALDAIDKLSGYVSDRQAVISVLIHNMRGVADQLGGRSPETVTLLGGLVQVFVVLRQEVEGVVDLADTAPSVLEPLDELAATLGLTPGANPDLDSLLRAVFPDPQAAVDLLGRLPGLLETLNAQLPAANSAATPPCSKGNAPVPTALQVLIAGQRISICNG